jgi:hypothetical protein
MRGFRERIVPRKKPSGPLDDLTISEPISTKLADGTVVDGVLWTHVSRRGGFEVEFNRHRSSDYRQDYTNAEHMRAWARVILAEMAGGVWPKEP